MYLSIVDTTDTACSSQATFSRPSRWLLLLSPRIGYHGTGINPLPVKHVDWGCQRPYDTSRGPWASSWRDLFRRRIHL